MRRPSLRDYLTQFALAVGILCAAAAGLFALRPLYLKRIEGELQIVRWSIRGQTVMRPEVAYVDSETYGACGYAPTPDELPSGWHVGDKVTLLYDPFIGTVMLGTRRLWVSLLASGIVSAVAFAAARCLGGRPIDCGDKLWARGVVAGALASLAVVTLWAVCRVFHALTQIGTGEVPGELARNYTVIATFFGFALGASLVALVHLIRKWWLVKKTKHATLDYEV